jgi:hypothetical protein
MADFTIDPEDLIKQRLGNRLAIEQGLPSTGADLEQRMPLTSAYPNATAAAQGIASPEQVQYTMQQLQQRFPTVEGGPGAKVPVDVGAEIAGNPEQAMIARGIPPELAKELAKHINETGPAKLIGKDIFGENRGGIFGTGVSPIDVLAFGIGAAITSRLPQDQAIATTMKIAGLPSEYKNARNKAGADLINQLIGAEGTATQAGNLKVRQAEEAVKAEKQLNLNSWVTKWGSRLSNGVPTTGMEQQQMAAEAITAGIPAESIKQFMVKPITEQLAELRTIQGMPGAENIRADITSPSGVKYRFGGGAGAEKNINPTELKIFADTGIKGASIPVSMDRATAKVAVDAQQTRDISVAGGKALVTSQNTPVSGETAKVINVGEDVQRQLKILKDNLDEGLKIVGPKHLIPNYTDKILPLTNLSEKQVQFLTAYQRLTRWSQQEFTGAAAGVEEMKKILSTLPQLASKGTNFSAALNKSVEDANRWTNRYGQLVTTPKGEVGKQFNNKAGYKKVED